MSTLRKWFRPVDNAPLVLFRILFGCVFVAESFGAILTGWVKQQTVTPQVNFTFIGFDFLQYLMGPYMYLYFFIMGLFACAVALGYKYRWSIVGLTLMWSGVYFMQKTSYNNHYYLMWLVALIMCFLPAADYASLDTTSNPKKKKLVMPQWVSWVFMIQISCVYLYATWAKFYPDWLNATVAKNMFQYKKGPELLQQLYASDVFHYFIAYSGIVFDGLIIPALLWKRTRMLAIAASLFFHIFNSITLQIGVFPYFALCFSLFFFPEDQIRRVFFKKKPMLTPEIINKQFDTHSQVFYRFFVPYLVLQLALPLRHYFIKGDVLWTEEGHRLSWRMMLRSRSGEAMFRVVDKQTNEAYDYVNSDLLTRSQSNRLNSPDIIWQMAQKIQQQYAKKGKDVAVFVVESEVSINLKKAQRLVDPTVDLASEKWNYFSHQSWILDQKEADRPAQKNSSEETLPFPVVIPQR